MPHNLTPEELRKAATLFEASKERIPDHLSGLICRVARAYSDDLGPWKTVPVWCRAEADRIEKESKEKDNERNGLETTGNQEAGL